MSAIPTTLERMFDMNLAVYPEADVAYSANNPATTELTMQHPILAIECRLTGNLVVGTDAATIKGAGALELIRSIDVLIDGQDVPIHLPGFMLQTVSRIYTRSAHATTAAVGTIGTNAFEHGFILPIDVGRYFSPLDASQRNTLVLKVNWGAATDMATAGASSGTIAVSSVNLEVNTVAIAGGVLNTPGGIGYPYPRHVLNYREATITAAQPEYEIDLHKSHVYSRLALWSNSDGALVNTIINKLSVRIGNVTPIVIEAPFLQAQNVAVYNWSSKQTGVYVLDLARNAALEQYLAISGSQRFQLVLDVSKPGTTDKVYVLEDRFITARRAA